MPPDSVLLCLAIVLQLAILILGVLAYERMRLAIRNAEEQKELDRLLIRELRRFGRRDDLPPLPEEIGI